MSQKDKHEYFQEIAGRRVARILKELDVLGGCSSPTSYSYDNDEVELIVQRLHGALEEVRQRLILHSPHSGIPFRLNAPETVVLDGHTIQRSKLVTMDEAISQLKENAPSHSTLEQIRRQYEAQFGDDLYWNVPVFHDGHSGCILFLVQQGVLYLPYSCMDGEDRVRFDRQELGLLTAARLEQLQTIFRRSAMGLIHTLADLEAFGLAAGGPATEEQNEQQ